MEILSENFVPLQTSYNSSDNDGGRPESKVNELKDSGEKTRSLGSNEEK